MNPQPNDKHAPGQLFVVATPIGNLADMTYRAVDTLKNVDMIAAEDTRTSHRLCKHYAIKTPMIACHEHNESAIIQKLLLLLKAGKNIALISDAGTPLISDPGFVLVRELHRQGVRITPIPGPCSPVAALSACGLPTDRFTFSGFLPRSGKTRRQRLNEIADADMTHIFLESPRRLLNTLDDLIDQCGPERQACVAREITKLYETFVYGTLDEVKSRLDAITVRGEIIVIIGPCEGRNITSDEEIILMLEQENIKELPPSARARQVANILNIPRSRAYTLLMNGKKS
ncbi:MAG: 16S rRNA (cytidine(1402)-2'-O)-methyltransferase [Zetaproteobacteria bacterium]|nr:MAG: 16S rRNA (cytidine(1402)-2'-O)-methyltransferase [Zetaproteobacteria bacterium]